MVPDAPPPHRLLASKPISIADAAAMLQTYISHSEAHPHLHPDALITPTGVTFSSHGGPTGGVVMHNLRRVAAGLRGEYLEPEPTPEPEEDVANGDKPWKGSKAKGKKTTFTDDEAGAVEVEWQDKEAYEREQAELEMGELGERSNVVGEAGEEPEVDVTGAGEKRKAGAEGGKLDKEARKKAKKERDALRKKDMEKKRADKA